MMSRHISLKFGDRLPIIGICVGPFLRNLVLDERDVTRLALYERQINAEFKSTYSLLERARAYRLGMPVPPPVSVDLTVSRGHDANGV
jgi:hypothetical protein